MKPKKISEIGEVIKGVSFDKGEAIKSPSKNYVPILRAGNITYIGLDLVNDIMWVPQQRVSNNQMLRQNDIVICMSSGSATVLGKNAQLQQLWEGSVGAFCAIIRFRNGVNPKYGSYWLKSPAFIQWRDSQAKGANIQNLRKSSVEELEIPLPHLAEQERIVCLLDEAEQLRKLRSQASERMEEFVPALFYKMFGDPASPNFPTKKLHEVAEVVSGVAKGRKFNGQKSVTVNYLRVANVQAGYLDLSEIKTIEALPGEVEALQVKVGDILLTEGGDFDKLGRGAMLEVDLPNCIHQNHVFRARVNQDYLVPDFFHDFLQTQQAKNYFLSCAKKTTNLASINLTQLRALPVPLPPLDLQRQFAQRVQEAREIGASQAQSAERIEALYQSMLSRAFAGEL